MKKIISLFIAAIFMFSFTSCHNSSISSDNKISSEDRNLVDRINENEKSDGVFNYESYNAENNQLFQKENLAYNNGENIRIEEQIREGQDDILYIYYPDHRLFLNKTKQSYYEGEYNRGISEKIFF